jgi:beta-mannosidase
LSTNEWRVAGFIPNDPAHQRVAVNEQMLPSIDWVPATVPGHVQSDLIDAGVIADPFVDLDSRAAEWTSDREWLYETRFDAEPGPARLRFGGVDHDCEVFLNGERLGEHHGMFGFAFDVDLASTNVLRVLVHPAPESEDQLGDTALVGHWKPRFTYWWDFSARLVPQGIWQDVWLEAVDGLGEVTVAADADSVTVTAPDGAQVTVLDPSGTAVATGGPGTLPVADPQLWWPNGFGAQPLYTVRVELGDEIVERRVGFRTLSFDDFQIVVNGTDVPALGWNWVPVHQLYGREHEAAYRNLIRRAKEAGATILRIWGGGLLERELFYDLCDEAGILVWQDFLQSSSGRNSEPSIDEEFTQLCREQARLMIRERRHHASLAIWCGGNELAVGLDRIPLTDDHPNAVALRETVATDDPGRAWIVTTPTGPVPFGRPGLKGLNVHGDYWHRGLDGQAEFYDHLECRFQGEVGCHGAANIETLRRTVTDLWPPNASWTHKSSWWNRFDTVEAAFGSFDDLETFVAASQWMQAQGLRVIVEAARRRAPEQTGVLLWQLNEPWPNTACSSVIDVFGHPKPGYWAVAEVYRGGSVGGTDIWYDAIAGTVIDGPLPDGLSVRVTGDRQEVVHAGGTHPLRPLLDVKSSLDVVVEGRQITVTANGGPLHGVFVQTVEDFSGPYVSDGWRWFVPTGESWTTTADAAGSLVVSALNAPPTRIEVTA